MTRKTVKDKNIEYLREILHRDRATSKLPTNFRRRDFIKYMKTFKPMVDIIVSTTGWNILLKISLYLKAGVPSYYV